MANVKIDEGFLGNKLENWIIKNQNQNDLLGN